MTKSSKSKTNKIFKGAVLGVACVLSLSAIPFASLQSAVTSAEESVEASTTAKSIAVSGAEKSVKKGGQYNIQSADYYVGTTKKTTISSDKNLGETGSLKTDISVKYKNSNIEEVIGEGSGTVAGVFVPTMVGTYTITYTVDDAGSKFSYDYDITCEVSDASFEFETNAKEVIPSIYDLSMMTTPKNIDLPTPKILDEKGEEVKDVVYLTSKPTDGTTTDYVLISVNGGVNEGSKNALKQNEESKKFYLDGSVLKESGIGTYTITYAYYQNNQFVVSTTKNFDIKENYYKMTDKDNAEAGYELVASFATTRPDKASTGVAITLPTVRGTTSSKNTPSTESVNVSYSVKVMRKDNSGAYTEDVSNCVDTVKNTFTAPKDGDYRFVYTVTDFYGGDKHTVSNETMTFYIRDVKDDVAPTVAIYDASEEQTLDEDGKIEYKSAKNAFKSETVNRNIVIYAIGANDNASTLQDMTLTRRIQDNGGNTRFTIKEYNDYNLIFNFSSIKDDSKSPYLQFVDDNFAVSSKMTDDDKKDDVSIAKYLKDNKYLIVTHNLKVNPATGAAFDFAGTDYADIETDPESANFDLVEFKKALQSIGVAYIENASNYSFSTQTYSVYYTAKDKSGNSVENDYLSMHVTTDTQVNDTKAPTITFSTSLQNTYLPSDTFKFAAPKFNDDLDRNVEGVVAYRYLQSDKKTEIVVADKSKPLTFKTNSNSLVKDKWYGVEGTHTSQAFIQPELDSNGEYKVDLSEKPNGAGYIEILVYGVDDYGNIGFWNKVITIAEANDNQSPILKSVTGGDSLTGVQGKKVTLPTLVYTDDLVDYMTQSVEVYYVSTTGEGEEAKTTYRSMPSENASTSTDTRRKRFVLNAGTFTASYAGSYRVVITVKDAGNNSIATFFDVEVDGSTITEDPVVDNLTSETIELDVDETYALPSPTIKVVENESSKIRYVGYEKGDDAKTATYYTVSAISAETNYYDLTKYHFTGRASGKYEIKYNVYLIEYNTDHANVDENGNLKFTASNGTTYFVFVNMDDLANVKLGVTTSEEGDFVTVAGIDEELKNAGIILRTPNTEVQKFKVSDSIAPVINIDSSDYHAYSKIGETIEIQRISAQENSIKGINPETSYVEVTTSRASGSSNTERIYMKDWTNKRENGNITYNETTQKLMLKLAENGNYKILYSVADFSGNVSTKEFSFANGDAVKPEIKVNDGFLNKEKDKYNLNDTLVLDLSKLDITDNITTDADKLKPTIKVVNSSTSNEVKPVDGSVNTFKLETAGDYKITVSVTDEAGWTTEQVITINVSAKRAGDVKTVYQVVGTVLIVLSVAILVGVIGYFIYSKVKLDKELKGANKRKKK